MEGIIRLMSDIEAKCWQRFKYNEIEGCNDLSWVYNRLALELEMPERLELRYSYELKVWSLDKEYLGGSSNV